jgi:hypothetical protein
VTKDVKRPTPSSAPAVTVVPKRKSSSQRGPMDGDATKDIINRSAPLATPPVSAASKRKSSQQGIVDGDVAENVKRSVSTPTSSPPSTSGESAVTVKVTTTTTTIGNLTSRKSQSSPATSSKEDMKRVETEKVDSSTPSSKLRKERAKTMPAQTLIPKTTTLHTFSVFAPFASPTNESANGDKPSLPPAGFSFPPPPLHGPQQRQTQTQQQKNSLNGSAAACTYALRQKANNSPKPAMGSGGIWMNMTTLLEEDEVDAEGDGRTPARKLRRVPNGNGQRKRKEKRISDSTSSRSDSSSHYSYSVLSTQSNVNYIHVRPPPT